MNIEFHLDQALMREKRLNKEIKELRAKVEEGKNLLLAIRVAVNKDLSGGEK